MPQIKTTELKGWLFDVYADRQQGLVLWFISENGGRYRFTQHFPVSFYLAGADARLRPVREYLSKLKINLKVEMQRRKELFEGEIDVLAIEVQNPALLPGLFHKVHELFPQLDYYDANISLAQRYHSAFDLFPLAYCSLSVGRDRRVLRIRSLDDRWALNAQTPPLRILKINPEGNPSHALPPSLEILYEQESRTLSTRDERKLLREVAALIESYDPDILATRFGDQWLFPYLFSIAKKFNLSFNPNRDKRRMPIQVKANKFSSYGRVVHRDRQTLLLGRVHIDPQNSMSFEDVGIYGAFEQARISGLPLQNAARRSPGGAFTAMQVREAMQNGVLVPLNKKQRERYKSASELIAADRGGIIYQPITGLHRDVAEIDFFSMYPSIMSQWNISPETVGVDKGNPRLLPGIERPISQEQRGIVPSILAPVLNKRMRVKLRQMEKNLDPAEEHYLQSVNASLKWLGWVSYGYQGFSGNRIGSIEAHEAINAVSRELLLRSKEAAEDFGFEVLHMYVDSLFITKEGHDKDEDFWPLIDEMNERTEITLELEGILRWIAFLPSKQDEKVPVPNCYFGVFQNGELKCRGIVARRDDTPLFIKQSQMRAIKMLAREKKFENLRGLLPKITNYFKHQYDQMMAGEIEIERLIIAQRLSQDLDNYRVPSAAARAGMQLARTGKKIGAGQTVRFLRTLDESGVLAWDLSAGVENIALDYAWYAKIFRRAAFEVLQPFDVEKSAAGDWLGEGESYFQPDDYAEAGAKDLPLFEYGRGKREAFDESSDSVLYCTPCTSELYYSDSESPA